MNPRLPSIVFGGSFGMTIGVKKIGLLIVGFVLFCSISITFPILNSSLNASVAKSHPLPPSLAQWKDVNDRGDYFESIEKTSVGYLIWSQFPVTVYVEQPQNSHNSVRANSAEDIRFEQWVDAVRNAIAEWHDYLPLQEINQPELADIVIQRSSVNRKIQLNPDTGLYDIPQAITAQTNYEFLTRESKPNILAHRMTIKISPDLGGVATKAAARHELGHGLGIWGHSESESDALYFSQVRNTPNISPRDINTLKKIYQQPTKLGWEID